jgi:Outer membrane protein beta-barrel domain
MVYSITSARSLGGATTARVTGLLALAFFFVSLFELPVAAQERFEIQPFVGYKYGGGADVAGNVLAIKRINIDSSLAYGVAATYNLSEFTGVEFLWNRQATNASGALYGGGTYPQKIGVTLDQFHGDFLLSFASHGMKLEPFVLLGLGATDMHGAGSSTTKFSFGVGGGVKYFVSRHLGFRIQARYTPTYLYSTNGGVWCNWWGYCWVVPNDHFLQQGDVSAGVILKF